ncbi:sodium channel modifier 1-like [Sinocyclocheilus grahami]|uniref:sodium channel modifier 1-like n=1 Tax=Sinocyclocheilus grahami TaxID=75366 RepID=UPI0007AC5677|nr:PREDICTED: sodium channel modifier 1-like [Sinocyclocheilus grahami]
MLVVLRKGKRHIEGMKWFYGKKNHLLREIDQRRHQDYVKAEDDQQEPSSSAPLLSQTRKITHALLRTAPYSSCHRKASERLESSGCGQEDRKDQINNINSSTHSSIRTGSIDSIATTSTTVHQGQTKEKGETKKRKNGSSTVCEPLTDERRKELEHYLKLKRSGWLQDRSGKWVKDENAEFDSDEEELALIPPCSESS